MVIRKKQKHRKFRGHRTYHGSHKKWRGGGSQGGKGMAGMHKHKWSYTVKYASEHYGRRGFKRPSASAKEIRSINLEQIEGMINNFLEKKFAEKEGEKIKIDLQKAGYEKVLAGGKISTPLIVRAKYFSKSAIKKIEEAGGKADKI